MFVLAVFFPRTYIKRHPNKKQVFVLRLQKLKVTIVNPECATEFFTFFYPKIKATLKWEIATFRCNNQAIERFFRVYIASSKYEEG